MALATKLLSVLALDTTVSRLTNLSCRFKDRTGPTHSTPNPARAPATKPILDQDHRHRSRELAQLPTYMSSVGGSGALSGLLALLRVSASMPDLQAPSPVLLLRLLLLVSLLVPAQRNRYTPASQTP